jgi:ketosteroid isomerase-like protein
MSEKSTTPGPVELTLRGIEAANRRDFDAVMSFLGPDPVWEAAPWGLGTHEGRTRIHRFFEDWIGGFDEYRIVVEEMLDLGNGVVLAVTQQYGHTAHTRGHMQLRSASVFVWAEGVVTRVTNYPDIDEGRVAAERLAEERV